MVELHLDRITGDAQVLQLGTQSDDVPFLILWIMFGGEPGDNTVCRQYIQDVQPFDHHRRLGGVLVGRVHIAGHV